MNSILIAMFVFICGLVVLLIYQISRLMELQEDLRDQLDEIHNFALISRKIQLESQQRIKNDINRNIDILHELLNEYTDTILKAIGSNNSVIDAISSYLEIMKNTILDMNDKINKPACGSEVNDTEEADLMPEQWTTVSPTLHIHYTEDENI